MRSVILQRVGGRVRKRMQCACLPPGKPHLALPVACTSSGLFFSLSSTGSTGYDSGVTAHWTFSFLFSVVRRDILRDFIEQQVLLP